MEKQYYSMELWWGDVDWMHVTRDRDQLQAVVNTVMNRRVPYTS